VCRHSKKVGNPCSIPTSLLESNRASVFLFVVPVFMFSPNVVTSSTQTSVSQSVFDVSPGSS
jgi:hypothetical protein